MDVVAVIMNVSDMASTVIEHMPEHTGAMKREGSQTHDAGPFFVTRYKVWQLPYIMWQEEGFRHWLSGKMVTKNQGFIANETVGALNAKGTMGTATPIPGPSKARMNRNLVMSGALTREKG